MKKFLLPCLLLFAHAAFGFDAVLTDDTSLVRAGTPALLGARPRLLVGPGYAALMKFDFSTAPAGVTEAQVANATLTVFLQSVTLPAAITSATANLVEVAGKWNELIIPTGLTFSAAIARAAVRRDSANTFLQFDVTALVKQWIEHPGENEGVAIAAEPGTPAGVLLALDSKENLASSHCAMLTVDFANSEQGPAGPAGPVGPTGPRGPIGLTGPAGLTGPTGPAGAAGPKGATGATGATGAAGATGAVGPRGATGLPVNPLRVALLKWAPSRAVSFAVGNGPGPVCFDGANIWVANSVGANITRLGTATGITYGPYSVGTGPDGICYDGAHIWVANTGSNNVTELSAATGGLIGTFTVGSSPAGLCFDGSNIWVANSGGATVTRLNASTGAAIGAYPTGTAPGAVCYDGSNIWVANSGGATVTELSASTGAAIGAYNVGHGPSGICFDGADIWVANKTDGTVTRLNASNGVLIGTYPVGAAPTGICSDGANIWVTNSGDNTVSKL